MFHRLDVACFVFFAGRRLEEAGVDGGSGVDALMDDIDTDGSDSVTWEEFISGVQAAELAARITGADAEGKAREGRGSERGCLRPALRWARIPWPAAKRRSDGMFRRAQQLQRKALDPSMSIAGDVEDESAVDAERARWRGAALKEAHVLSQKAYHLCAVYQGLGLDRRSAEQMPYAGPDKLLARRGGRDL